MKKIFVLMLCLVMLLSIGCNSGGGAKFPSKDLKLIVPFAPGGAVDVTCRMITDLTPQFLSNKKIVVENMDGGGGVIGQTAGAKAKADGYTLLGFTSSVVTNPMTKETTYTHKDFQPVVMYCNDPEVVVVPANSKFKTLEDFINYAKENEVSVSTPGHSTSHHIAALILQNKLNLKFSYLHNQGAAMQVQQLLGGHVDVSFMAAGEAMGQIKDGKLIALGTMDKQRRADLPDMPTFKEKGIDIEYGAWRGLAVPKDSPKEAVDTLAKAFKSVIESQEFKDKMTKAGYPVVYLGPEEFEKFVNQSAEDFKAILPTLQQK